MKTRFLSMIMAVCMVAALVPALLIPALAVGTTEGFTTDMALDGPNWPSRKGTTLTGYNGNWSFGTLVEGKYVQAEYIAKSGSVLTTYSDTQSWRDGGLMLGEGKIFLTNMTSEGLLGSTKTNDVGYYEEVDGEVRNKVAVMFTYTAQYEGKIDVDLRDIRGVTHSGQAAPATGVKPEVYVAIMVNDDMIWPVAGGDVTNPADFYKACENDEGKGVSILSSELNLDALKNIDVQIGDKVRFVLARCETAAAYATPSVTYHEGYSKVPNRLTKTFSPNEVTWPAATPWKNTTELYQTDKMFKLGVFNADTGVFTTHTAQRKEGQATWTGTDLESVQEQGKYSGFLLKENNDVEGSFLFGKVDDGNAPAFLAVAPASGTLNLSVDEEKIYVSDANMNLAGGTESKVSVYKNGTKLGDVVIKVSTTKKITVKADDTLTGVNVEKGDELVFVGSTASTSVKQLRAFPVVSYTAITSFLSGANSGIQMAVEDATVVVGDKIGLQVVTYATKDTYAQATSASLYVWNEGTAEKTLDNADAVLPLEMDETFAYCATYTGFGAKNMADSLTMKVVVMGDDGVLFESTEQVLTVAEKATAQYNEGDSETKKLMAAVLNYGAYAQLYFNHKADDLANKGLPADKTTINPDDYLYYAKDFEDSDRAGSSISNSEIKGFSLRLEDGVAIKMTLDLDDYEVKYFDTFIRYGDSRSTVNKNKMKIDTENGAALTNNISLKDLSTTMYYNFAATKGVERYYGYTWAYSVEIYAARMMDSEEAYLPEMLCALMELGKLVAEA